MAAQAIRLVKRWLIAWYPWLDGGSKALPTLGQAAVAHEPGKGALGERRTLNSRVASQRARPALGRRGV